MLYKSNQLPNSLLVISDIKMALLKSAEKYSFYVLMTLCHRNIAGWNRLILNMTKF